MSTTAGPSRLLWILLLAAGLNFTAISFSWALGRMEVVETEGRVEWARVVPELGCLEMENSITVRALRGFGLLPETFARLALQLRKDGVDLLAAGPGEIRDLLAKAESGYLATDPGLLSDLLSLFENRDYYDWNVLEAGDVFEPGESDLIRGHGRVVLRDETGQIRTLEPSGTVGSLATMDQASVSDEAASYSAGSLSSRQRTPGADDVKEIIEKMIEEQSHGKMKISGFDVTETLTREYHYLVEFAGRVEFLEDARWLRSSPIGGRWGFKTMARSDTFTGWEHLFVISQNPGSDHKTGEEVEFQGSLVFEQTDSGWRVARVDVQ